jgi:outer membrane protein OmpA-like peptidoglycan-associated protein
MASSNTRAGLSIFLLVSGFGLTVAGQVLFTQATLQSEDPVAKCAANGKTKTDPAAVQRRALSGQKIPQNENQTAARRGRHGRVARIHPPRTTSRTRKTAHRRPRLAARERIELTMKTRSATVTAQHRKRLRLLLEGRKHGDWEYVIVGYAAERSSRRKNRRLARRRARRVARYLHRRLEVPAECLSVRRRYSKRSGLETPQWRRVQITARKREKKQ